MFSAEFWAENWVKLLFGLMSTGILTYITYLHRKFKNYRKFVEERDDQEVADMVDSKIKETMTPILRTLDAMEAKFNAIRDSYRYRLIALCEIYLNRGYLTPQEYHQLSEMWRVYSGLGGNSQAEDYYHKVEKLPVREHDQQ